MKSVSIPLIMASNTLTICEHGKLINWKNDLSYYEQKSIAVTFGSQLEALESKCPDYSNFFKVLSFFDPERISLSMITEGVEELKLRSESHTGSSFIFSPEGHADGATDKLLKSLIALILSPGAFYQAIQQLQCQSLVGYSTRGTHILHIHDAIKATVQEIVRTRAQYHWFHMAAALACGAFRRVDDPESHRCWDQCEIFSPHIQSLTKWGDEHAISNPELDHANIRVTHYLRSRGRYGEAETLLKRALAIHEKLPLVPDTLDALQTMNDLGIVYRHQGRYNDAEAMYKRVLQGREDLLGPENKKTLDTVNNLGIVYAFQGRYREAEELYGRALEGREKWHGPESLTTLRTVEGLAILYRYQGRYMEAERLHERSLAGRRKTLGPENPDTLRTLENLAIVYQCKGQYKEAEALYTKTLAGNKKHLGSEHPQTLRTIGNLANIYQQQGRFDDAEKMYRSTLPGDTELLWSENPDILRTMNNLALTFQLQRRHSEAESLYMQALAGNKKYLGPEHPNTLRTVGNLAITYFSQGRFGEAEEMYRTSLAGMEKVLGREHPHTLQTKQNIADFLHKRRRHEKTDLSEIAVG